MEMIAASRRTRGIVAMLSGACLAFVVVAAGSAASPPVPSPDAGGAGAAAVIARYRERIPQLMADQGIPGLAVALVDGDTVLWTEGFGHTDRDGSPPVTVDTIFSVQSMSKNFTATAVMQAVQTGRLRLDEPIATYLPDFTVHSAFEDHPERKITLRMLLSHTAGFTHEAPIGNNFEFDAGDFDEHVRSISDTWLRFPVGTGYAYSNLGIDLAGYILERVEDKPFAALMRDSLLQPLGMNHSTFDRAEILATADRAVGHTSPAPKMPVEVPMAAAGGLYSSAADLARYLRFQLNDGSIDGRTVLDPARMEEMRTIPAPFAGTHAGYALGVVRYTWHASRNADLFSHGGGGFGFLSDLWWSPSIQVGVAILTNSTDHDLQGDLALSILGDLVHEPGGVYQDRLFALPPLAGEVDPDGRYRPPADMASLIAGAAMRPTGDEPSRWAGYSGIYRTPDFGILAAATPPGRFDIESGTPFFETDATGTLTRYRLTEIERGLFLADNGETLDFRASPPTWRNLDLIRVSGGPAPWQWVILGIVGLVALAWLVGWLLAAAVAAIRRRRARPAAVVDQRTTPYEWRLLINVVAALTAFLVLGTIALLAVVPTLVDSGFLGWLEWPLPLRLALHLPLALSVLAGGLVVLGVVGWAKRWWSRPLPVPYAALTLASVVLVAQLAAWRLIGWGLS